MKLADQVTIQQFGSAVEVVSAAAVSPVSQAVTLTSGLEDMTGQDTVVNRLLLVLPVTTVLTFQDAVVWRGDVYEIDGTVGLHTDRAGRPHHLEAFLRSTGLLDLVELAARVLVSDSSGGQSESWAAWGAPVPALLRTVRDAEPTADAGQVRGPASASLMLPLDVAVSEGDRVRTPGPPQRVWAVVAVLTTPSVTAARTHVLIREVK